MGVTGHWSNRPPPRGAGLPGAGRWLAAWAAVWAVAAGEVTAARALTGAGPAADRVERDLRAIGALLADDSATQAQRDESARRLVARKSEASSAWAGATVEEVSRELLLAALVNVSSRGGQLAAARALMQQWEPDPAFIAPLNALLGVDRPLTEAAAMALSIYTNSPQVPGLLLSFAESRQRPEGLRVAVVRALGMLPERRVAAGLLELARRDEAETVRAAALAALAELTGLPQFGTSLERWSAWWDDVQRLSEVEFRAYLARTRATQQARTGQRLDQLIDQLGVLLPEGYRQLPEAERTEHLRRLLSSPSASVRAVGVRLVLADVLEARPVAASVRETLRTMVGDSSRAVRLEVATALRSINDAAALDVLLTQLPQETSPEVRAALALALGPIRDVRATDALLSLLGDADVRVAEAAAESLAALAPEIRRHPAMADVVATAVRSHLLGRGAESASLRGALLEVLVPLRRRELLPLAQSMLEPSQPSRVRRAAVRLLGELSDPGTAESLKSVLASAEGDASLRLEAVSALGALPTFDHAETLYRHTQEQFEPDALVRARAWALLAEQFQRANRQQLRAWAGRLEGDDARQLDVLTALVEQLRNPEDGEALALAQAEQGKLLLRLDRPAEAAVALRSALDYWRTRGAANAYVTELSLQTLEALLRSGQFAEAVNVTAAASSSSDASLARPMSQRLLEHARGLLERGDAAARLLLEELRRVAPSLPEEMRERFTAVETRLGGLQDLSGRDPVPGEAAGRETTVRDAAAGEATTAPAPATRPTTQPGSAPSGEAP
ncbi:MAG: HEAT repeat domain-containing protein [Tepidisphaerales bacterium]